MWTEVDLDKGEWRYHVSKTKTEHLVPLATQAITILRELYALMGSGRYVFPGAHDRKRPMSEAAINAALRLEQKPEMIEHQLAHAVPDNLGGAYNRTRFIKERRTMMQTWANYLDAIKAGAKVIRIGSSAAS